jgi:hypothetical protein
VSLHGSTSITLRLPDAEAVRRFYEAFGRQVWLSAAANDMRGHLL